MTAATVWEVIGWVASAVLVISLLQTQILRLRVVNLIGCLISIAYNGVIGSWPVVGLNVALAIINIVQLWRLTHTRHDPAAYQVARVAPSATDSVAARFLANHAEEIERIWPDGGARRLKEAADAFLVLKGDQLVGLVALAREGTRADVLLDYVAPAYRDLTPGEFVFRTSGTLTKHGYDSVRAPLGPVDYYERIGFTRSADGYTLALA